MGFPSHVAVVVELLGGPARRSIGSSAGAIVYSPEAEIIQPIRKMTTHTKASVNSISLPRECAGTVWPSSKPGRRPWPCVWRAPCGRQDGRRAWGGPDPRTRAGEHATSNGAGEIARGQAAEDDHRGERDREHEHRPRQPIAAVGLLFRYAIECAEHRPRTVSPKGQPIRVDVGSFFSTWALMATETGLSKKQLRRAAKKLDQTGMMLGRSTSGCGGAHNCSQLQGLSGRQGEGGQRKGSGREPGREPLSYY